MSKDENKKLVPNLRFKGFTDDWMQRELSEISEKVNKKNVNKKYSITLTNSATQGIVYQEDYFNKRISNKKNVDKYYIVEDNDFIYNPRISLQAPYGPINRNKLGMTGIMSPLYYVFRMNNNDIDPDYLEYYFKTSKWHKFMYQNGDTGARSDRFAISNALLQTMPINIPSISEQSKIGKALSLLDKIITLEQEKLDIILETRRAFLRKIYSTKYNNNMTSHKLNAYISRKREINKDNKEYIVSSVNNKIGFINQHVQFENTRLNNLDKSTYRIVRPKHFAYNPSRINVGSIGYNDTMDTLIVSPLYIVFNLNNKINDKYFYYYTQTEKFLYEVNRNTEGSVRQSLTFENMGNIDIPLPENYNTQLLISQYFNKIDNIIFSIERKINNYKEIKTYLFQILFV